MSILNDQILHDAAIKKNNAEVDYTRAWTNYQARTHEDLLDIDVFWNIVDVLRTDILYPSQTDKSKKTMDEVLRRCVCKDLNINGRDISFDDMVLFGNNWEAVTSQLHSTLYHVVSDKGDDGYGDLIDNLPILGRGAIRCLLVLDANDNHDNDDVQGIIRTSVPKSRSFGRTWTREEWEGFIWNGENYWSMSIGDALQYWYVREALDHDIEPPKRILA